MFPDQILTLAEQVLAEARARGFKVATAESCTGGLVAAALTEIAGASDVVDRGFVTYSNLAKQSLLGVPPALLTAHGAVSEPVARAMAEGALAHSDASLAVAVTGVAGPAGGSADKPVGLVWFGLATSGSPTLTVERRFTGLGRSQVRLAALEMALRLLLQGSHQGSP